MIGAGQRRFVVLHHTEAAKGAHWDLMLEDGEALATWQVFAWPPGRRAVRACEIFRHRRRYLEYEGALSGGRGTVLRVDSGDYEILDRSPDQWIVSLRGTTVRGRFVLARVKEQDWTFGPAAAESEA
jgi:hypothetical protein